MGYIYIIKNYINEKVYIGQTKGSIEQRFLSHIKNSKYFDNHLYLAMRKYGTDNFFIEPIEEVADEKLDEQEIYWIKYYNSYNNGYNMTIGGQGNKRNDYQQILDAWNNGKTINQIKELFDLSDSGVISVLNKLGIPHEERRKRYGESKQICESNYFLELWNKGYGLNKISQIAHSTKSTIKKRLLDFGISEKDIEERGIALRGKAVIQKDLNDKILKIYPTASEAGRQLGLKSWSQISNCCTGRRKTAYGYKWEYYIKGENT